MAAFGLLALLAACASEAPPPVSPPAVSFREAGTMIASTTRGGVGDMAGEWVVSQAFPGGAFAAPGMRVTITMGTDMNASWAFGATEVSTVLVAPGRYEGTARLWVLWVDDDFRTAVVGTPDGSFGWIMDRPGEASPDRTEAARRMLAFNGYDLSRLAP